MNLKPGLQSLTWAGLRRFDSTPRFAENRQFAIICRQVADFGAQCRRLTDLVYFNGTIRAMQFNVELKPDFSRFTTLAFAGGGNRCWWQGGLMEAWLEKGLKLPSQLIGTSAGAAVAAACISAGPRAAMASCLALYAQNDRLLHWPSRSQPSFKFAHEWIYPAWLASFVGPAQFRAICQSGVSLRVAVTHPGRWLGLRGSLVLGSLAYLLDKKLAHSVHPRLPKFLGLRQAFYELTHCSGALEAQKLLQAAAAAAPFMRAQKIEGQWGLDGGYTDNAPLPEQSSLEKSKTLVLLTRHYPKLPTLFGWQGRTYWQPSQKVPVSTWDCRPDTQVQQAYELGLSDARRLLNGASIPNSAVNPSPTSTES